MESQLFTHPALYYPVPQSIMSLSAAKFMTSLPAESISKEAENTMKEWAEHYRPVRQRTFRSETTKHKAGALPPAVYDKTKPETWSERSFSDLQPLQFLMNQYFCLRHLTVRLSLLSVTVKFLKPSSPLSLTSPDDSDYDENESESR